MIFYLFSTFLELCKIEIGISCSEIWMFAKQNSLDAGAPRRSCVLQGVLSPLCYKNARAMIG